MFATDFAGNYIWANVNFEPSAKVYALWERENAYADSLGTPQAARTFSSGRASAGNKVSYPCPGSIAYCWRPNSASMPTTTSPRTTRPRSLPWARCRWLLRCSSRAARRG